MKYARDMGITINSGIRNNSGGQRYICELI